MATQILSEKDFKKIVSEVVKAIRGQSSQATINQKLGATVNQMYRWESGYRSLVWSDFTRLCEIKKIPLDAVLCRELGFNGKSKMIGSLIAHLKGPGTINDLSRITGFSRSVISNWLNGKSEPTLAQFLTFIHRGQQLLIEFVGAVADLDKIPTLNVLRELQNLRKQIHYKYPIAPAILADLDTKAYLQSKGSSVSWIANDLSLDEKQVSAVIALMMEARYFSEKDGKLQLDHGGELDTRGDLQGTKNLRKYWLEQALKVLENTKTPSEPHRFACYIISVSENADLLLRKALYEYVSAIKTIVMNDEKPRSQVRAFNLQDILLNVTGKK